VSADGRTVPVRILRPERAVRAVYLEIHGGGFFMGSARMDDGRTPAPQPSSALQWSAWTIGSRLRICGPQRLTTVRLRRAGSSTMRTGSSAPLASRAVWPYTSGMSHPRNVGTLTSPLFANLHGVPPALFTVGTQDSLYEDSLAMATRWDAAGNYTELAVHPESPHAFDYFPTQMARAARHRSIAWLGRLLD